MYHLLLLLSILNHFCIDELQTLIQHHATYIVCLGYNKNVHSMSFNNFSPEWAGSTAQRQLLLPHPWQSPKGHFKLVVVPYVIIHSYNYIMTSG